MPSRRTVLVARGVDHWLLLPLIALLCIGLLMVYGASILTSYTDYGSQYYVLEREVVWVALAGLTIFVCCRVSFERWRKAALPLATLSFALLILVLIPHFGHMSHGARRWFDLRGLGTLQPSELAKLGLVLYGAAWLNSRGDRLRQLKTGLLPFGLMVCSFAALILKEPDLGTAIILATTLFSMYFLAGGGMKHLAIIGALGLGAGWVMIMHSSYQYARFIAFLNPWHDPTGNGYQIQQALLALGSGGIFGDGMGNSAQKLAFLPAPDTDSILAFIGEEWGLIGTVTILCLFLVIAYRGIRITVNAPDGFSRLLAGGITSWITFQALMNFAVITSSIPFTGVPLPFISYGGSSMIIGAAAMGILLNISRYSRGEAHAQPDLDNGRGNRRSRLPRAISHPAPARPAQLSTRNR
ncbi:MAG: putative lipid II flippase FtsW [Chloroflexota bacterium]